MIVDYTRIRHVLVGGIWLKVRRGSFVVEAGMLVVIPCGTPYRSGCWAQWTDDLTNETLQTTLDEIKAYRYDWGDSPALPETPP